MAVTKIILAGSKTLLSKFVDFKLQSRDGTQIDRVQLLKYLGVKLDEKWSWKSRIYRLVSEVRPSTLTVFNRISHLLDMKS